MLVLNHKFGIGSDFPRYISVLFIHRAQAQLVLYVCDLGISRSYSLALLKLNTTSVCKNK